MDVIELTCPVLDDGRLPPRYACDGDDVSPPLEWKGVPDGARVLALIMEDADADGGPLAHWVAVDIGSEINGFEEAATSPTAVVGENDFGDVGYRGPCPPPGDGAHRYFFLLYALNEALGAGEGLTAAEAREAMEGRIIGRGEVIATYQRDGG